MTGCSIPSLRKNSFAAIAARSSLFAVARPRLGRAKPHKKWFILKEAICFRDGGRRSRTMDTGDLAVFAAVAQAGGHTKAAQPLQTGPSQASQRAPPRPAQPRR